MDISEPSIDVKGYFFPIKYFTQQAPNKTSATKETMLNVLLNTIEVDAIHLTPFS